MKLYLILYGKLEKIFQTSFGGENSSAETRDVLLYSQLQEGLSYTLMESPLVSDSQNYKELCIATKEEERRLAEQKKKQQCLSSGRSSSSSDSFNKKLQQRNFSAQKSGSDRQIICKNLF